MSDVVELPRYRYRGSVEPSAAVSRPVAAVRNAAPAATNGVPAPTSATLDIFDVIDSCGGWWGISANDVDAALKQIGDVDTLYVRLNSLGGEATEGVAIANLLRAHSADVRVTVYGIAASAASVIAIVGDVVSMGPGSLLMVHEASNIAFGTADDIRAQADVLDTLNDAYASLYALKAGGTADEWRATMNKNGWYTPESAVAAKLADRVGLDPQMPADLPPVEDEEDEADVVIEIDVEYSPAARALARRCDLSLLPNAPAALAPKTPADPPVAPSTTPEEADTMSDTIPKAVLEALGLPDDADEATVASAVAALKTERDEAKAQADARPKPAIDPKDAAAALEADGKVVVSKTMFDEIKAQAAEGSQARAKQLQDERDETIAQAVAAGKISRARAEAWTAAWDKDPEGTKADLESLGVRFPVAQAPGVPGGDGGSAVAFTDDEAAALGALAGVSKEALTA